jgi:hypothetical protein
MCIVIIEDQAPISGPSVFTLYIYTTPTEQVLQGYTKFQNGVISSLSDRNRNNGSNTEHLH